MQFIINSWRTQSHVNCLVYLWSTSVPVRCNANKDIQSTKQKCKTRLTVHLLNVYLLVDDVTETKVVQMHAQQKSKSAFNHWLRARCCICTRLVCLMNRVEQNVLNYLHTTNSQEYFSRLEIFLLLFCSREEVGVGYHL